MKLHHNIKLFQDAVRITAQQMNIPPEFIEKDYWVTYALHTIFNSNVGKDTVFKGGTALSKCYKLIERFSEDIDLVLLRRDGETDSKLKSKIRDVSKVIEPVLPEVEIPEITNKRGMNRKTAHSYKKNFNGNYGQLRDVLVLESTWLGHYEPCTQRSIVSYVGNMMINNGQKEFSCFFNSTEFDKMLLKVANDDVASFRNNNQWLVYHPKDAIVFAKLDDIWKE